MLDFNQAGPQTEGNSAIPPDSVVPLKMTLRQPKAGKEGTQHSYFSRADSGNEYLDVEFEAQGTFDGKKIWQNFTLYGSDKAAKINMRTLRAIIESSRNINPNDSSPRAAAARQLSDWLDFNGMIFLARVKCVVEQSSKDGNWYVNNEIAKIITPDMPEYQVGEHISDKPLPTVPAAGQQAAGKIKPAAGPGAAFGAFGGAPPVMQTAFPAAAAFPAPATTVQPTTTIPPATTAAPGFGGMPGWAAK